MSPNEAGALVMDPGKSMPAGAVFGHLSLLTAERRENTVVASSDLTVILRLNARDARQLITKVIGGTRELETRLAFLEKVELFNACTTGELVQLAAVTEKVVYDAPGETVARNTPSISRPGWKVMVLGSRASRRMGSLEMMVS